MVTAKNVRRKKAEKPITSSEGQDQIEPPIRIYIYRNIYSIKCYCQISNTNICESVEKD